MVNKRLGVQVAANIDLKKKKRVAVNMLVIYNFLSTVPSRIKFNLIVIIIRSGENSHYNRFLILFFIQKNILVIM